jgi:lantibiotic biosynthesis protein
MDQLNSGLFGNLALQDDLVELLEAIVELINGPHGHRLSTFGVGMGRGGAVLLNCHYAAYTGQDQYYEQARVHFEQVVTQLDPRAYRSAFGSNYFQELAEIGILLCYFNRAPHLEWDSTGLLEQIDELLAQRLYSCLEKKNFDRVNGALSIGAYFLRRIRDSPTAQRGLDMLLVALREQREGDEQIGYFWTCYSVVEPRVYTGLSHGSAMVIGFLTSLYLSDFRPEECAELLHGAIRFLLASRLDPNVYLSTFPLWHGKEEITNNMCIVYGDLSTAHALVRAALALNDTTYLAEAISIASRTTTRTSVAETYLHDASVFYGTSSAYLLYISLHKLTNKPEFASAAAYWLAQVHTRAVHQNEYLNFSSYFFEHPPAQLGLNLGLIGIGLTLIQAFSDGQYTLDEFIWLS